MPSSSWSAETLRLAREALVAGRPDEAIALLAKEGDRVLAVDVLYGLAADIERLKAEK